MYCPTVLFPPNNRVHGQHYHPMISPSSYNRAYNVGISNLPILFLSASVCRNHQSPDRKTHPRQPFVLRPYVQGIFRTKILNESSCRDGASSSRKSYPYLSQRSSPALQQPAGLRNHQKSYQAMGTSYLHTEPDYMCLPSNCDE